MALALSHPAAMSLTAPQLAAFIAALVCCEVIRRPMSVWTPYHVRRGGELSGRRSQECSNLPVF